ncbi:MAG: hypothetical protein HY868_01795 [Chloroflexi bacterium]|nr:hypothetical protein [Chloroflexota bacterium]
MNLFNRLLVIAELLIAIALMPIALVLVLFYRAPLGDTLTNTARMLFTGASALYTQVACVSGAVFVFIVSVGLLYFELQRGHRRQFRIQVAEGQVELSSDLIAERLERAILQIADVTQVKPRVTPRQKNRVDVLLELETAPEMIVPEKTQQVITAAKQVLEQQLGLTVGAIQVRLEQPRAKKKPV